MRKLVLVLVIIPLTLLLAGTVQAQNDQSVVSGNATQPVSFPGSNGICTYKWDNDHPEIGLAASGTGNLPAFTAVNNGTTPITATITATLTSPSYAYIVCSDNTVSVINTLTNAVIANIPVGTIPYGVSVSPDGSRAYVTAFGGTLSVIDVATNTVINTVTVSQSPIPQSLAPVVVSPDGKTVYAGVFDYSQTVQVIDAVTNMVTGSIPVGFGVSGLAINGDGSRLYVCNQNDYTVSVVNTATKKVITTINTGAVPNDLRLSPDGNTLYVTNILDNTVTVYNTQTYGLLKTINMNGSPSGLAFSPDGSKVYVTNYYGSVQVIDAYTYATIANIDVPGPEGISVTADGKWVYVACYNSNSVAVIDAVTNKVVTQVTVGSGPEAFGNFISSGPGCSSEPITFTITVYPKNNPFVTVNGAGVSLQTVYGTPSASTGFTVSGNNLTAGILVTPPTGFEVSSDNINFSNTITLPAPAANQVVNVYCRLAATTQAGPYSGSLTLSSAGATNASSALITGIVNPAPLIIAADDKTREFGAANPIFTATYTGFVNGDGPQQLITQPIFSTTANLQSEPGKYPITVTGAASPNYTITFKTGLLTITPPSGNVVIPNAFSPNGDGINDQWHIKNIEYSPGCIVFVYNRWGQRVYASTGYGTAWDGTENGSNLPVGVYYYVIRLNSTSPVLKGNVTIIR